MRRALALAAFLVVASCATPGAAPQGPFKVGSAYRVELGRQWASLPAAMTAQRTGKFLTIDGPSLNLLQLVSDLKPGQSLLKTRSKDDPVPVYRADMSQTELAEFLADTLAALGYQNIATRGLRPAPFGTLVGVRFDVSAQTPAGLNIEGTALMAQRDGKLNFILYLAPQEHYYALHAAEVERILRSVTLL